MTLDRVLFAVVSLLVIAAPSVGRAAIYTLLDDTTVVNVGNGAADILITASSRAATDLPDLCASLSLCNVDVIAFSVTLDASTGATEIVRADFGIPFLAPNTPTFLPGPGAEPYATDTWVSGSSWYFGAPYDQLTVGGSSSLLIASYPLDSIAPLIPTGGLRHTNLNLSFSDPVVGPFRLDVPFAFVARYPVVPEPSAPALLGTAALAVIGRLRTSRRACV